MHYKKTKTKERAEWNKEVNSRNKIESIKRIAVEKIEIMLEIKKSIIKNI